MNEPHGGADPMACACCDWRGPLGETAGDPGDFARCPRCGQRVLPAARLAWMEGRPPDGRREGRPVYLLPPEFFARRPAP